MLPETLLDLDRIRRVDYGGLVARDTSSYCTDRHPPSLHPRLRMRTHACAAFQSARRPLTGAERVLREFGRLRIHIQTGAEEAGLSRWIAAGVTNLGSAPGDLWPYRCILANADPSKRAIVAREE